MAAREATKLVADALSANLQTKLNALTVTAGESVPVIARFMDPFSDDVLEADDWPAVITTLSEITTPTAQLEAFGKADVFVPLEIHYVTRDPDSAQARQTASYAARAILQTLNDVVTGTENNVQLVQYRDLAYDFVVDEDEHIGAVVRLNAHMRDNSP